MKSYNFPTDKLRLRRIYESEIVKSFKNSIIESEKIDNVYGKFLFPPLPEARPYVYGSFVTSIDGRIAFPESPDGSLVAKSNFYDPDGGLCDFWLLSMLRSVSDALVMGGDAIRKEPNLRGVVFDRELLKDRINSGRFPFPLNIVITGSGEIPVSHRIVVSDEIPLLIVTSPVGRKKLLDKLGQDCRDYGQFSDMETIVGFEMKTPLSVIAVGYGIDVDISLLLRLLRGVGIKMLLVESPTFLVSLMREGLVDEIFLNISSLFIGGNAPGIGDNEIPFGADNHPHAQVLTVHAHSDYFFYFRYRMRYDY